MSPLTIDIDDLKTSFQPGQIIRGQVHWQADSTPPKACLRLLWYTKGKGTEDVGIVENVEFSDPQQNDRRPYQFKIPEGPYSFSGELLSLVWSLELVVGKQFSRQDITVSPDGHEIRLHETVLEAKPYLEGNIR
ncbi:MAG: hypothetical protein JXB18_09360 [Sedimentisphaerales bacterium]|nr:hypothetical protein [Sedimentisphaerales bacterium]